MQEKVVEEEKIPIRPETGQVAEAQAEIPKGLETGPEITPEQINIALDEGEILHNQVHAYMQKTPP